MTLLEAIKTTDKIYIGALLGIQGGTWKWIKTTACQIEDAEKLNGPLKWELDENGYLWVGEFDMFGNLTNYKLSEDA